MGRLFLLIAGGNVAATIAIVFKNRLHQQRPLFWNVATENLVERAVVGSRRVQVESSK
jgi:hypothetical protein